MLSLPSEATLAGLAELAGDQITSRTGEITFGLYADSLGETYLDDAGDSYDDGIADDALVALFDDVASLTARSGSLAVTPANDLTFATPASQAGLSASAATSITG